MNHRSWNVHSVQARANFTGFGTAMGDEILLENVPRSSVFFSMNFFVVSFALEKMFGTLQKHQIVGFKHLLTQYLED